MQRFSDLPVTQNDAFYLNEELTDVLTFSYWSTTETLFFQESISKKFNPKLLSKIKTLFKDLDAEY